MVLMVRTILAAIAGLTAMMVSVFVVESTGHLLFPPPADTDLSNPEMLKALMPSLPLMALVFVILAWALGAFVGAVVACRIALEHHRRIALGIGLVMIALSVVTMLMIPHPIWMVVMAVVLPVPIALLGARIATPKAVATNA
jgi:MFS family permease